MSDDPSGELPLLSGLSELADLISHRDWMSAQALGQRLVAAHPTSPSAHAALGDIAAAQHQYAAAAQWYGLALRLEPDPDVQARLERVQQAQLAEAGFEEARSVEGIRPPRITWLIAGIGLFVVLALVVAIATARYMARQREPGTGERIAGSSRPAYRPGASGSAVTGATPTRPSTRPMPADAGPGGGVRTAPGASPGPATGPNVTQNITQSVAGPMSDADLYLTRSLGTLTWSITGYPLGTDVQASMDPFSGYCLVTVQIPKSMPQTPLYPLVMETAYTVAINALRTDPSVDSMTIRFLATLTSDSGKDTVLVAFRGNTDRLTIERSLQSGVQPDLETLWSRIFAATWWNPSVPYN